MSSSSGQLEGINFAEEYASVLFALDDRWRAIHRKVWSIRGFFLIPGFFRRVDFAGQAANLGRLSLELEEVAKNREVEYSGSLKQALDEYCTALKSAVELLADLCGLLDRKIYRGDAISDAERNRQTSRYLTMRELAKLLRRVAEDLLAERKGD